MASPTVCVWGGSFLFQVRLGTSSLHAGTITELWQGRFQVEPAACHCRCQAVKLPFKLRQSCSEPSLPDISATSCGAGARVSVWGTRRRAGLWRNAAGMRGQVLFSPDLVPMGHLVTSVLEVRPGPGGAEAGTPRFKSGWGHVEGSGSLHLRTGLRGQQSRRLGRPRGLAEAFLGGQMLASWCSRDLRKLLPPACSQCPALCFSRQA